MDSVLFSSQLVAIQSVVLPLLHGFVLLFVMVFFMDWFRDSTRPR